MTILTSIITLLLVIGIFGSLILVHEFGHFLVARWSGVRVLRFSIGFGQRIWGWKRGETEYWVSWIPFGGYVKMAGEQESSRKKPQPGDYLYQSIAGRVGIVAAGPIVNYLTAVIVLACTFMIGYPELLPTVGILADEMPAQAAGLQEEDLITSVGGVSVGTWEEMTEQIEKSAGREIEIGMLRGTEAFSITLTPEAVEATDVFGDDKTVGRIGISPTGEIGLSAALNPIQALSESFRKTTEWVGLTVRMLATLVSGKGQVRESVAGPIGIGSLIWDAVGRLLEQIGEAFGSGGIGSLFSDEVKTEVAALCVLVSLISLSLAIFNFLPIPVLDGGHLLFLFIEQMRGRPVSLLVQERSAQVSMVMFIVLMLVVSVNDIERFGWFERLADWVK